MVHLCLYDKTLKVFDAKNYLNANSITFLERNVFWRKKCPDVWKNGIQWVRDQENMVDMVKSHIPVSFSQYVTEHCHEVKLDVVDDTRAIFILLKWTYISIVEIFRIGTLSKEL